MQWRWLVFLCGISTNLWWNFTSQAIDWLAYGDIRGHFESCGCDPQTDLGGVVRLATLVNRERSVHPDLLLFDLGNNFSSSLANNLQNIFIQKALARLEPDVSLVNIMELEYPTLKNRKTNYVLSNRKKKSDESILPSWQNKNTVVLGYTFKQGILNSELERYNSNLKNRWLNQMKNLSKRKILLFSGDDSDLRAIIDDKIFDEIISSNSNPFTELPGQEEKDKPERLKRQKTWEVFMVPLGGTGVLRGGTLRQGSAKSVGELFADNSQKTQLSFSKESLLEAMDQSVFVSWLDREYSDGSPLADLAQEYKKAAESQFDLLSSQRSGDLKDSPFVGSLACQGCHADAFKAWKASKHAHALLTLQTVGKDKTPECVSCHVLGFNEKGGFVSVEKSPQFANVQCETCHGPRKEHISNPTLASKVKAKEVCISCHHDPHSPSFDFQKYWSKITHGR